MNKRKLTSLFIELIVPLTVIAVYWIAVNPTGTMLVKAQLRAMAWHARNAWKYINAPAHIREAMEARGRLPFFK